jgi:hypothetical protein
MMIVMVPAQHPDRNPRQSRRCNTNKSTIEEMRVANVTAVHSKLERQPCDCQRIERAAVYPQG